MQKIGLLFPHQLYENHQVITANTEILLIEEFLFFRQYAFHQHKLIFHRASMKAYADFLEASGKNVRYVEAMEAKADIRKLIPQLAKEGLGEVQVIFPNDDWLLRRIQKACTSADLQLRIYEEDGFLTSRQGLESFFGPEKKRYFHHEFYQQQRQGLEVLMQPDGQPQFGKWSLDEENRKKYPKKKQAPAVHFPPDSPYYQEAQEYVARHFADCPGKAPAKIRYPVTFEQAQDWWHQFLEFRFSEFGPYEDAMVSKEWLLHHSLLSPLLNVNLLQPQQIMDQALGFAKDNQIAPASIEGFVRQLIGWREFIRGMYLFHGRQERSRNFWNFKRKIPASFYEGTTGIIPLDLTIKKVLDTGYCHHIERLMVLGNFMLLCEFDPDEVYRWFMELFIDAYDWVMVPNVYGMSQFADGGMMATKPYISSSNYLRKMGDFPRGEWEEIWDGLFWRFLVAHQPYFKKSPRMNMLLKTFMKKTAKDQSGKIKLGEDFLKMLDQNQSK
ncbi:cryptochrome/photolyase family protein [Persicobacter diffluens]|uniref:Cryptochrome/photolyase family protein n=1 Tax=Persicobacter diffluens TaxID=981 RepID=A0AAN4VYS2_9BACT|nr:cryptochrome/photolyase family protein [Persicobacter diffluens]